MGLRTLSIDPNAKPITVAIEGRLTCRCPVNGRRDHARIEVVYTPVAAVIELESFAAYLDTFTARQASHELVTVEIGSDIAEATEADDITVRTHWDPVEGIGCTVVAHR